MTLCRRGLVLIWKRLKGGRFKWPAISDGAAGVGPQPACTRPECRRHDRPLLLDTIFSRSPLAPLKNAKIACKARPRQLPGAMQTASLGHLKRYVPAVADHIGADLDQLSAQAGQRSLFRRFAAACHTPVG
jgi:hypothetical protein